jgi:hypothetical protein
MTDHVRRDIYDRHLRGVTDFAANSTRDRLAVLQRMYVRMLTEACTNRFKWINLPKTIDVRFMELTLFRTGLSVFFYEYGLERFVALQGTPAGRYDFMNNPRRFRVYGNDYTTPDLPRGFCVPIWSNYLRVPDWDIVMIYSAKLAELDLTIEINMKQARRTKIIAVNENQRLTAKNIARQIDEGQSAIEVAPGVMGEIDITALDLGVDPDSIEKLHILKVRLWQECMGYLGINGANQDKKERLVASEVDANDEQVDIAKAVNLNARKQAVQEINDKWGLEIEVMYQSDIDKQSQSAIDAEAQQVPEGWNGNTPVGAAAAPKAIEA